MKELEAKKRIKELRSELEIHRIAYHVNDRPIISDEVYDSLMYELVKLEKENPEYKNEISPSIRIGGHVLDKFKKVKHDFKQWSFDNVFNYEELVDWEDRNRKIINKNINSNNISGSSIDSKNLSDAMYKPSYMCEMKIDGLKIILTYKNGILMHAATRGDGEVGEDVTENIKTIKTIPLILKDKINITVVGEAWIKRSEFVKINKQQEENNLPIYANTRNLAAGTLRQLDSNIVAKRKLQYFAYDLYFDESEMSELFLTKTNTQESELKFLEENCFMVNKNRKLCKDLKELQNFYEKNCKSKNDYEYGIDGMVIKINEISIWNLLGYTAKSPRGGVAYKFPADQVTSIIESISFQVGRTGTITPVANLSPVFIAGSTVSRATLHNQNEIDRLKVMIGDTVILQKAGDVIPEIVGVIENLRNSFCKKIIYPEYCPSCMSKLVKRKVGKENSVGIFCDNAECDAKLIENLIHFVSKKAMNIEGLGVKTIEEFSGLGIISNNATIYELKEKDIIDLFGYGKKSAENIIDSIKKSTMPNLNNFIYALGIFGIGEVAAKDLAKNFKTLEDILKASVDDFLNIKNIGDVMAVNIYEYFKNEKNIKNIVSLLQHINIKNDLYKKNRKNNDTKENVNIYKKTFVITGTFTKPRSYYQEKIESYGGIVTSSVSKKTDYLICGDSSGSKLNNAKEMNIKILNESEFMDMI